ncbi:MAG TPA: lipase maturation factor family protein [Bryobacteraceae bacterium]|nr:lipase maturation factor family protein [Bryobacteraceae bacterium]
MEFADARGYWLARLVFQRSLAVICLIAFIVALNQFRALCGNHGLLPIQSFVKQVPYHASPSLFYLAPHDIVLSLSAWAGIGLSIVAILGISERHGAAFSMLIWALIWILYLSFVNTGQIFYAFGWESILLEAVFLAIFLGAANTTPQRIPLWLIRWLCFRVMFGAGLIKLRGDECWRQLTCLDWHYETQPMPNPFSWFLHWGPEWTHKGGVLFNHFSELIVPFGYFLPQPFASIAGIITIVFQFCIMLSGNLSWLNALTIVLATGTIDDRVWHWILRLHVPLTIAAPRLEIYAQIAIGAITVVLSIPVVANMLSARQMMNFNYNPFHLVGTYGAFGSVTRPRYEVIVEGTMDSSISTATQWKEYEFKGKPGNVNRMPPQIAPYHLRLDWLMWFAAMSDYQNNPWFLVFADKLLKGDPATLSLISYSPFGDKPPAYVRALLYEYHFTAPEERARTGAWWTRKLVGTYLPPVQRTSLETPDLIRSLPGLAN